MKNNKTAIILIGLQASGKTSFYKEQLAGFVHISLDTLHTRRKESLLLMDCLERGESFVIDNTNPQRTDWEKYIRIAKESGYRICSYYFQSSIGDCLARNRMRAGKAMIPDIAILGTHNKLELPAYDEGFDELYYVRLVSNGFIVESWREELDEI